MDIKRIFVLIESLLKSLKLDSKLTFALSGSALLISCLIILYKLRGEIFSKNSKKVIIDEDLSVNFKDMISEMNKRFLNFAMAPIVININCTKSMTTLGSDNVRFSNSSTVNWIVNDRMAIINILKDHEMVLKKLQDMTNGFGFQCVNFYIDYDKMNEAYKVECLSVINQYRSILSKFGINASCFVMAHVSDVNIIDDKRTAVGTRNNIELSLVDEFTNQIISSGSLVDLGLFSKINNLSNIADYFFDMFGHYGLKLSGFYMCSSQSNEYTFVENFLILNCYNSCSDVKINFKYYSTKSRVFNIIRNTAFAFFAIISPLLLVKVYLTYCDLKRTETTMYDICHEKPIAVSESEHVRLQTEIDFISHAFMNLFFKNENIVNKTINIINNYNVKILNEVSAEIINEVFDRCPSDTYIYTNTMQYLRWIFQNIKIDDSNRDVVQSKIDFICDRLFSNYYNHSLLLKMEKLVKAIDDIDLQGLSPENIDLNIQKSRKSLSDIDKYFVPNLWWISNDYELKFNMEIDSIIVDDAIKKKIIEKHSGFLNYFREKVHNYQHRAFGKFFSEKFDLSQDFIEFRDLCYDIFSDIIFSVNFSDLKILENNTEFPYIDVRVLEKNINLSYINNHVNSIKNDKQKLMFKKIASVQSDVYLTNLVLKNTYFNDSLFLFDKIQNMVDFFNFSRSVKMDEFYIRKMLNSGLNIIHKDIIEYVDDCFIKLNQDEMSQLIKGNTNIALQKYHYMMSDLNSLNKAIEKIVFYFEEYNVHDTDIIEQISNSIKSRDNKLLKLVDFINSFATVEEKYRRSVEDLQSDLINWKCITFMNEVIEAHNNQLSSENVKNYQELVSLFDENIKDYLINFSRSKLDYLDVINSIKEFTIRFNEVKENLFSDEYFNTTPHLANSIKKMEEFSNMFLVMDDKLFLQLKIKCHVVDNSVIDQDKFIAPLVHNYAIIVREKKYQDIDNNGFIICKINCENSFEFVITLSEQLTCDSPMKNAYDNFVIHVDKNVYRVIFNNPLNFIDFVNRFESIVVETNGVKNIIREIVISVIDETESKKYIRTGFIFHNFKSNDFNFYTFKS